MRERTLAGCIPKGNFKEKPKVQLLKFEQKVLATFSPEQVEALLTLKPKGRNQSRAHAICYLLLDSGLQISEALSIRKER